jgi:hypothetical protein
MRLGELSELMGLNRVALERNNQVIEDLRIFIRDMTRRNEKIARDLVRRNEEFNAEQAGRVDTVVARLNDLVDESMAQRQGLFAAIDRLPPPHD